ncbi:hypothetical protein [Agriterribacter sp.]|mgnify:CR=1 FL=1|uniref:TapB family protein n=1 Tax=Agriterribacter sp. TaxID=2821509 RepID=UPI002CB73ABA|nr:hypothetical protein [Agriterribacter sp.]HRO45149.1 hypothetical protein [Agriterribacter sp.]HRQ17754.1 hypothetical protein [Agriterribacter sp.]
MKDLLLVLPFILLCRSADAQACASFYLLQDNKTIELAVYNNKGNPNGTILYNTSGQSVKGSTTTATLHTTLLNKAGKPVNKGVSNVKCSSGTLMMDMNLFLPQQQTEQFNTAQAKVKNAFIEYPAAMQTGDKLRDGTFDMEIDNNGVKQVLKMQILDRTVTGAEKISTKAGAWDCVTITYRVKLNIQTGPISIPLNFEATEWFAPGFGIVKTGSEAGSTEIVAIR